MKQDFNRRQPDIVIFMRKGRLWIERQDFAYMPSIQRDLEGESDAQERQLYYKQLDYYRRPDLEQENTVVYAKKIKRL